MLQQQHDYYYTISTPTVWVDIISNLNVLAHKYTCFLHTVHVPAVKVVLKKKFAILLLAYAPVGIIQKEEIVPSVFKVPSVSKNPTPLAANHASAQDKVPSAQQQRDLWLQLS